MTDGFVELVDDDDLSQEQVSYCEMCYTSCVKRQGIRKRSIAPTSPVDKKKVHNRTEQDRPMSRTSNNFEGYNYAFQSSLSCMHSNVSILISALKKTECLVKLKKAHLNGDNDSGKKHKDVNKWLAVLLAGYNSDNKTEGEAQNLHQFLSLIMMSLNVIF